MRKVDKSAGFLLMERGSVARTSCSALTSLKKKNCYNGICYLNMPDCSVLVHLSQRHISRESKGHLPQTSCLCNCQRSWWDVTIWFHYAKVTTQDHRDAGQQWYNSKSLFKNTVAALNICATKHNRVCLLSLACMCVERKPWWLNDQNATGRQMSSFWNVSCTGWVMKERQ